MIYEGTYRSLIQGVSQQTPQERLDGQLGAQVNMLSDPVNGLRRRTGTKLHGRLDVPKGTKFELVQLGGEYYIQCITPQGRLVITRFSNMGTVHDSQYPYLIHDNKNTIRSTISRNQCFILNTNKVPTKVPVPTSPVPTISKTELGWVYLASGAVSINTWSGGGGIKVDVSVGGNVFTKSYSVTTQADVQYTTIAYALYLDFKNDTTVTSFLDVYYTDGTISFKAKTLGTQVVVTAQKIVKPGASNTVVMSYSNVHHVLAARSELPATLPTVFDNYAPTVNGVVYLYNSTRNAWTVLDAPTPNLNPKDHGWVRIVSGAFSKAYSVSVSRGEISLTFSVTTHASTAAEATPTYVATQLESAMNQNATFTSNFTVSRSGTMLAISALTSGEQLSLEGTGGELYITTSGASIIKNKDLLPPLLPPVLNGYIQAVGTTNNLVYFKYDVSTKSWGECGAYEARYTIQNTPVFWYFDYDRNTVVVEPLDIQGRNAGDDNNNPEPAFINFGITGIGAYQSRLILLSGAYVCMSKSTDPTVFMRTTVEEVLDDDPIEISATSLSNSQFEYAVPFNKDLVLFSNTQQAVIPANNTVLTPKGAVIYPSTQTEVSMAVRPIVAARSLYYTYQRGLDYYQIGELIPNQYTDAQYNPQNLTDHLPLYATGVCTGMAGSSTNNMVVFTSDAPEVLINQFVWQGDQRNIMGFHKWVLPRNVLDVAFLQEYTIFFAEDTDGNTLVLTTNTQLNQLGTKPVPFLDIYQYVYTDGNGGGDKLAYVPEGDLVGVIYDDVNSRHMEVQVEVKPDGTVTSAHAGTIAVGLRYTSLFTLTPPYLKDQDGNVLAGVKSTVQSFPLTFRGTGEFKYTVHDFIGEVSSGDISAATWSEVNLGYTWINSISTTVIPCRSRLDSLTCTIQTDKTTDLNLTTAGYVLRTARKHAARR